MPPRRRPEGCRSRRGDRPACRHRAARPRRQRRTLGSDADHPVGPAGRLPATGPHRTDSGRPCSTPGTSPRPSCGTCGRTGRDLTGPKPESPTSSSSWPTSPSLPSSSPSASPASLSPQPRSDGHHPSSAGREGRDPAIGPPRAPGLDRLTGKGEQPRPWRPWWSRPGRGRLAGWVAVGRCLGLASLVGGVVPVAVGGGGGGRAGWSWPSPNNELTWRWRESNPRPLAS